jgi:translation initiation factor 2B subunit (eIF-2B alpha/beta/delta family)
MTIQKGMSATAQANEHPKQKGRNAIHCDKAILAQSTAEFSQIFLLHAQEIGQIFCVESIADISHKYLT